VKRRLAVPCCSVAVAPAPPREIGERTKEHRPPSSAPRSVRSLGDVRGEEGGGKAGSGREERHEERAGEKEEARQGAARSRWGAPSCRAGFGVSASFIVGFVRTTVFIISDRYQQSLLLFTGVSVNLRKIPRSARPKFQRFSYPTSRHDCVERLRWSGDPTDLKFALNTPNNLFIDALGLVSGVYSS